MATGRGRLEAPNHTQTPNELLDYWMPLMGGAEFKVHMAICRKTFGWHQREDKLSASQLCELTGLTRNSVRKAVEEGLTRGTIARRPAGDSWVYALVLDGQLSLAGGSKTAPPGAKNDLAGRAKNDQAGGAKTDPTKEIGKKLVKETSRGRMSARDRRTLDRLRTITEEEAA